MNFWPHTMPHTITVSLIVWTFGLILWGKSSYYELFCFTDDAPQPEAPSHPGDLLESTTALHCTPQKNTLRRRHRCMLDNHVGVVSSSSAVSRTRMLIFKLFFSNLTRRSWVKFEPKVCWMLGFLRPHCGTVWHEKRGHTWWKKSVKSLRTAALETFGFLLWHLKPGLSPFLLFC